MKFSLLIHLLLLLLLLLLLALINSISANLICSGNDLLPNSTYAANRDQLLLSLASSVTANSGFYNISSKGVYTLGLCSRNYRLRACRNCVDGRSTSLIQQCSRKSEAYAWGDIKDTVSCYVRYSNTSSFGKLVLEPVDQNLHPDNLVVANLTRFGQEWGAMVNRTLQVATLANETSAVKYYGVSKASLTQLPEVYMLMQCTPDITSSDCRKCLSESVVVFQNRYWGRQGGEIARPSCFFRWDLYNFYGAFDNLIRVPAPPPAPPAPPSGVVKKGHKIRSWMVAVITFPTVTNLVVFTALICLYRGIRRKFYGINGGDSDGKVMLRFDLDMILTATDDFSDENKLGQGGFGSVYKGMLPNQQEIAVKRLARGSGQGYMEFKNEVVLLTRLQHRNLVKLLGFCNEQDEEILVYEFVPNSSLDHFIFDSNKRSLLTWDVRSKIIEGVARGLLYLHEDSQLRIIHRDLKASNILLDADMNPKVSDFGMARLFHMDETQGETSRVVGTYGYMAPEYVKHGQFSVKSDVYSFGVVLLEMITGDKNSNFRSQGLPAFAWKCWIEGKTTSMIDPILKDSPINEITKFIHIGLLCVQDNVARRPTMNLIILWLGTETATMPIPTPAAFTTDALVEPVDRSSSSRLPEISSSSSNRSKSETVVSLNDVSITELYPR